MCPEVGSSNPRRMSTKVVLPAPDSPIMPTCSPEFILNETFEIDCLEEFGYLNETLSNSIVQSFIHPNIC